MDFLVVRMSLSKRARDQRATRYVEVGKNSGLEISQPSDLQTSNKGAAESHRPRSTVTHPGHRRRNSSGDPPQGLSDKHRLPQPDNA